MYTNVNIVNVRYSATNAYYSLDSRRDFEHFREADFRQTVEGSRPGSDSPCRVDDDVTAGRPGSGVHIHSGRPGFKGLTTSFPNLM